MLRADLGDPGFAAALEWRGFRVTDLKIYRTSSAAGVEEEATEPALGDADAIVFASPSAVEAFMKRSVSATAASEMTKRLLAVCIGPVTAKAAQDHGFERILMPKTHTIESLVQELGRAAAAGEGEVNARGARRPPGQEDRREATQAQTHRGHQGDAQGEPRPSLEPHGARLRQVRQRVVEPVEAMPGINRYSVDTVSDTSAAAPRGDRSVLLFGIPDSKDEAGSEAYASERVVPRAIAEIKKATSTLWWSPRTSASASTPPTDTAGY